MNLLEHKILEVISSRVLPEEIVDMEGIPGFENERFSKLAERLEVIYKYDCYGQEGIGTRIYFSNEDFQKDLNQGYYLA